MVDCGDNWVGIVFAFEMDCIKKASRMISDLSH